MSLVDLLPIQSLSIKVRGTDFNDYGFMLLGIYQELPPTVKFLQLQPASALDTIVFLKTFTGSDLVVPVAPVAFGQTLTRLSLVVRVISDTLVHAIADCLPLLVELELKDIPIQRSSDDLSNLGIQSLANCKHLTSLSLTRGMLQPAFYFERTNDLGMFMLSEGCKGLEIVRLGRFSNVSDAGFSSILNSCVYLKKFEIQDSFRVTDLAFQDSSKVRSLVEVKLVECLSITGEAVSELATSSSLKVLDLHGCVSVGDSGLDSVSRLTSLTYLNLGGTDVTNVGMAVLGRGDAPISCLSLRGCGSVSDEGIVSLLGSEGKIRKTLSSLDLGNTPALTDNAITAIADACVGLTELCIRYCIRVTDASLQALALKGRVQKLDLFYCTALSNEALLFLKKPVFRGLQWIGTGWTDVGAAFDEICRERHWLTVCKHGCEVGCRDR